MAERLALEGGTVRFAMVAVLCCWGVTPVTPLMAQPQAADRCFFLCQPELKIEPTITFDNLFRRHKVSETDETGKTAVVKAERERVLETVIALDIPTTIPRVGFTFETIFEPFEKGNSPELELELNLTWLRHENTRDWVESHFDIVDKYSPGERPNDIGSYTHKLDFELDTSVSFLKWTRKPWLSDIEIEGSLDYLATGLPRAGDRFGNSLFLDNASRWSFSVVFVLPIAPLHK